MRTVKDRIIKNWITTCIGILIALVSLLMWYEGKIEASNFFIIAPIIFGFIWVKHSFFKQLSNNFFNNSSDDKGNVKG
jgi:hypothetical protein